MSLATPLRRTAATITTMAPRTTTPTASTTKTTYVCTQCRHATLLRRPQRPYTFTQLVTLSDGSTYTQRTTSPTPVYRSTRDTRNSLMWNPSSSKLMNVEEDEAGRLAAFRARFGRSWDANTPVEEGGSRGDEKAGAAMDAGEKIEEGKGATAATTATAGGTADQEAKGRAESVQQQMREEEDEEDNLLDLISAFGQEEQGSDKKK